MGGITRRALMKGTAALIPCTVLRKLSLDDCNGIVAVRKAAVVTPEEFRVYHGCTLITVESPDRTYKFQGFLSSWQISVDRDDPPLSSLPPHLYRGSLTAEFQITGPVDVAFA